jgi:hypothetical protein
MPAPKRSRQELERRLATLEEKLAAQRRETGEPDSRERYVRCLESSGMLRDDAEEAVEYGRDYAGHGLLSRCSTWPETVAALREGLRRFAADLEKRAVAGGASAEAAARLTDDAFRRRALVRSYEITPSGPWYCQGFARAVTELAAAGEPSAERRGEGRAEA